jgi:hypothetical protein
MQKPLIVRVSKINRSLILACNIEKVYRVFLNGVENFNGLDYNQASDIFNSLESSIYRY